jgi:hypothetical protein
MKGRVGELNPIYASGSTRINVTYSIDLQKEAVTLSDYLGAGATFTYVGEPHCIACAKLVKKLYSGGHCFDCAQSLARCDLCVVSPDRCHFHLGTCREPQWGEDFCMQPHVVYLANTSGPKIGITRANRMPRRWLDQGASQAIAVVQAPTRRAAGVVEAHFKRKLNDRTDWRRLVSRPALPVDLMELARQLKAALPTFDALHNEVLPEDECGELAWRIDDEAVQIEYPVLAYSPSKRLTLSEDQPQVRDNLQGIVGQYLLFSQGVINLGDYRGVALELELGAAFAERELSDGDQLSLF